MNQEEFKNILQKYRSGTSTEAEKKLIEDWYASIGSREEYMMEEKEEHTLEAKYWSALEDHIRQEKQVVPLREPRRIISFRKISIAAVLLGLVSTTGILLLRSRRDAPVLSYFKEPANGMKHLENYQHKQLIINLPDGSKATLKDSSRIWYAPDFGIAHREIYVTGEVFFEVIHDQHHPFLVYTGEAVTKVLGTSFTVKALPLEHTITVSVRTGKVAVTVSGGNHSSGVLSETVLTSNQQVVYDRQGQTASRMLVKDPQVILPPEEVKKLRFTEAPVGDIFKAFSNMYGVNIIFDAKTVNNCVLTTSAADDNIFNRLDIICKAIGATYKVQDAQILIKGSGCN